MLLFIDRISTSVYIWIVLTTAALAAWTSLYSDLVLFCKMIPFLPPHTHYDYDCFLDHELTIIARTAND